MMNNMTSPRFSLLLVLLAAAFCFASSASEVPQHEVQALEDIVKILGKKDWAPGGVACGAQSNLTSCYDLKDQHNQYVICDCTNANGTVCRVTGLCLKRQDLNGKLPPELVKLDYLKEIDLTFNYLDGEIPKEWGSMTNLTFISLGGNRLTGSIPAEIGNISALTDFVVEFNQLSGNLPPELGNLTQLKRLQLNSNNFSGELPATLAKLTSLQDVRIGGNQFSGKIPDFIQSWTRLRTLIIQGSGLSGPIPSGISLLGNLTDLRISDLNGTENSPFPQLINKAMQILVLRSCNINGTLPAYLGAMTNLTTLDLSFNKLTGQIPPAYQSQTNVTNIYLTGNFLTGLVPAWTKKAGNIDLSYNYFNLGSQACQDGKVNLFDSSLTHNDSRKISCLRNSGCSKTVHSLHINCGGQVATINEITYDSDINKTGPSMFYKSEYGNWAFSSTGNYMDNSSNKDGYYIVSNGSKLSVENVELYMNARVSPVSLTYYGFCLENGNYLVNLHFAEIMFTDDKTHYSLGRRVFDIFIQGNLVQKDFNIAEEAGGNYKEIIKHFKAIVTDNTLEIRFYWAGKGTTAIPFESVHGPLISAISVEHEKGSSLSAWTIAGIVAAVLAIIIILVFGITWKTGYLGKKNSSTKELNGLELQTSLFSLRQIKAATNDFDITNKIGEGGFGPVYKGCLPNGTAIAVKQLSSKSRQGNREFLNEIGMISALQHPYLVKLYGCCVEGDQLLLVYEYMENNSLARALFGPKEHQIKLDWPTRHKICIGMARGLAYLHEESRLKVVHRDIKATNVLLDKDLNPKICDFGLAKLDEEDNTHISTRIAGTYGYMAPEYAMHGYLTYKVDVYSFGIVALEIVSGMINTIQRGKEELLYLLDWARLLKEKGNLIELVDRRLCSSFNEEEVMVVINVALLCTNASPTLRPTMSSVVSMLEGNIIAPELVSESSELLDEKKLEALRLYYYKQQDDQSISMEAPLTASSTSAADLYPVNLDSSYLEKRN